MNPYSLEDSEEQVASWEKDDECAAHEEGVQGTAWPGVTRFRLSIHATFHTCVGGHASRASRSHHVQGKLSIPSMLLDDGCTIIRGDLIMPWANSVDHGLLGAADVDISCIPRATICTVHIGNVIPVAAKAAAWKQSVTDLACIQGHNVAAAQSGTDSHVVTVLRGIHDEDK